MKVHVGTHAHPVTHLSLQSESGLWSFSIQMFQLILTLSLLYFVPLCQGELSSAARNKHGSEEWGYVQVRPKAHMFWWLYRSPHRMEHPSKQWPIILWLQGGPGASGIEIGNFGEVGPLDYNLEPRNSTWLRVADLLFVDNPVGTGYSFVEDKSLFVKTDDEAAADLTTLLQKLFNKNKSLQNSPLYIVAESYGGKFAVTLALSALKAIEAGTLKLKLGGVALGDSWISPEDFVLSWGPLLKDVSRLDYNGLRKSNSIAQKIKQQIRSGRYYDAIRSWDELESFISTSSSDVDFYNFLSNTEVKSASGTAMRKYSKYLSSLRANPGGDSNGDYLMDILLRKKLKIIPENILFDQQSDDVFKALQGNFMKARIDEVDELLEKGVNVTIYNGQLDLICSTNGAEAWVEKLKWKELDKFMNTNRKPLSCGEDRSTKGFFKSYKNLHFYWILGAGHFVPVDQPCVSLKMVQEITQSPASL